MLYCISSDTSSKKRPKLRILLQCKTMVFLTEGSLFFTNTTRRLCLWWEWTWRPWSKCVSSGLTGVAWTHWCGCWCRQKGNGSQVWPCPCAGQTSRGSWRPTRPCLGILGKPVVWCRVALLGLSHPAELKHWKLCFLEDMLNCLLCPRSEISQVSSGRCQRPTALVRGFSWVSPSWCPTHLCGFHGFKAEMWKN